MFNKIGIAGKNPELIFEQEMMYIVPDGVKTQQGNSDKAQRKQ